MLVVIGASGHIGNNLVRQLIEKDISFKVLLRKDSPEISDLKLNKEIGNLLDPNFYKTHINKDDVVVHLAGYIDLKNKDYKQSYQVNYVMTKLIAEACLNQGARLIYISTTDILVEDSGDYKINTNFLTSKNNYHKTKTLATLLVHSMRQEGLNTLVLYPSAVIGINDYKGSQAGREIKKAMKYRVLPYVRGGYDFVDVVDVASAIIRAAKSDLSGDIILSGEYFTIKELYQIIAKIVGHKIHLIYIPSWLAKIATYFMKNLNPMMIEIVSRGKKFNDPQTKLLIPNSTLIEKTFENIIKEYNQF